ncbi:MAG TPA: carbohydrate kinase family protein [Blastocatellia bacterium]|nr:carbohydrate kinase family protein [Blastocatellia bacterium]
MEFGIRLPSNKPLDIVGFGLNAVDHLAITPVYPPLGSKVLLSDHRLSVGGQVATAMVALSRLGFKTSYAGKVGAEPSGDMQIDSLVAEGVDCAHVIKVDGATTQLGLIVIDQVSGERTIFWYRDPRLTVNPNELNQDHITSGRLLHLDGCDTEGAICAAQWAKQAGVPVVIDLDTPYPGVERLLPLIDFLVASSEFPEAMTGINDRQTALKTLKERYDIPFVTMTLGGEGALAFHKGEFIHSPAFTNFGVKDTTGAGDAFHGGFDYGLLQGYSVEETLQIANLIAALNCAKVGARGGLPNSDELSRACGELKIYIGTQR